MLKSKLLDLEKKNVRGKILTSDYLKFNSPKALEELMKFKNAEVRVYESKGYEGFHMKGYGFDHETYQTLIIGSSNLTIQALKTNHELNLMVTSLSSGEIVQRFYEEFDHHWQKSIILTKNWIDVYQKIFSQAHPIAHQSVHQSEIIHQVDEALIIPNQMQEKALANLKKIREEGAQKALLISATGTGKTFLSAFDTKVFNPNRLLFIVHREQILQKARQEFKKILGGRDEDFGIYSGQMKEKNAKYLFATIQTISKDYPQFTSDAFDYILIDEVHKAGAKSYETVIQYFKPKFMMGMTATPERNDDFNIFKLFDHHIAYEIRLKEALAEDMLCPFHYYGVSEFEVNGEVIDEMSRLKMVQHDERIDYLLEKINHYGYSGDRLHGLIFCARNHEAKALSEKLNQRGLKTLALSGEDSQENRQYAISLLEKGELEYLITVDIFNEGIDIPSINQVIFLRQTQSSIIFIQQLGRGLRKSPGKSFVTVIDFIGNYDQNYLIPIALSSDSSCNRDTLRRRIFHPYMSGLSSIHFDEISKQKIYQALSKAKLNHLSTFEEAYYQLRFRLNRLILPSDFIYQNSIDPEVIHSRLSYTDFLSKVEGHQSVNDQHLQFTTYEKQVIAWFEREILNGKRKHEIILLGLLCDQYQVDEMIYLNRLNELGLAVDPVTLKAVLNLLNLDFCVKADVEKYGKMAIVSKEDQSYILNDFIVQSLKKHSIFRDLFKDYISTSWLKSQKYHDHPLCLYEKYTRRDVCRLLNWENDESSTIYGYKTKYQTCPIFVTYHKATNVQGSVQYHDHFRSQEVFHWFTRSKRTLKSAEVQTILNAKLLGISIHIFVKKDDEEGLDFYYLGTASVDEASVQESQMASGEAVVSMDLILKQAVPLALYEYLIKL